MAEDRPDELEGWGVRWRWAVGIAAGFFAFLAAGVGLTLLMYQHAGAPHVETLPAVTFPAPRLNARLDRDPHWSFAPPYPLSRPPDPEVRRAMAELAAKSDAGYAPLQAGR